uniref:Oxysterol-binding protein n=1 Tax=Zonotrichia albicollis TaxID=44394 RepID=A0A8D2MBG7_ZONAL
PPMHSSNSGASRANPGGFCSLAELKNPRGLAASTSGCPGLTPSQVKLSKLSAPSAAGRAELGSAGSGYTRAQTQAEMAHTCRGTINLSTAHIDTEDSCNIVLSNGGRTYHLKANSEVERQRWVTALELAKAKAIRMHDSGDEEPASQSDKSELHGPLKTLSSKLEDLSTCNELIAKHGAALQRSLSELENLRLPADSGEKIKAVNERATLFRITSNAMINVSDRAHPKSQAGKRGLGVAGHILRASFGASALDGHPGGMPQGQAVPWEGQGWREQGGCDTGHRVNFNEPLSMLQRLTEDLEYHELLDKAVKCESSTEQMCFVAAFSVSSYSTTVHRTAKPFNPLLGETFELDRLEELGFRSLCEQVSHHPPAAAHHVYSRRGWTLWQEITIASKFRGKYLSIMPLGAIHLEFHSSGNHYVWRKVTSTVHNIIVGKLWIDQSGEIEIVNHKSKDKCQLKFTPYSYFSRDVPRKVTGVVSDADGKAHYVMSGTWDEKMECSKILHSSHGSTSTEGKQKTVYQTLSPKVPPAAQVLSNQAKSWMNHLWNPDSWKQKISKPWECCSLSDIQNSLDVSE